MEGESSTDGLIGFAVRADSTREVGSGGVGVSSGVVEPAGGAHSIGGDGQAGGLGLDWGSEILSVDRMTWGDKTWGVGAQGGGVSG